MNTFSYTEYKNIIALIRQYLPIVDFKEALSLDKFCVLRHDIEFSIDRALKMALIEKELGVTSTYTVQLRNNTYNALSQKNIQVVKEIRELGHNVGLHQNPPCMEDEELVKYIQKDIETLEHYYGFEVDRFAFHRCRDYSHILGKYIQVSNKINCYDESFFHYFEGKKPQKLRVHYLADSNHKWKYGHPIQINYKSSPLKMQLLTHPFSWTEQGYENTSNFAKLIKERNKEMLWDMETENVAFPHELLG
jgi:hypothetical protein